MSEIRLLVLDVDGVLTPGDLMYGPGGEEIKRFYVLDGGAIRRWRDAGYHAAIISGRSSSAVSRRAADLGVSFVRQGMADKVEPFLEACKVLGVEPGATAVVGDDLLDIPMMRLCAVAIAVANAVPAVKRFARFVTRRAGGDGAVLEAVERLMRHNRKGLQASGRR